MSWEAFVEPFKAGAEVRFNRGYLKSSGSPAHHEARGKITGVETHDGMRYATVEWDRPGIPELVNVANLAVIKERKRG